MKRKVVLCTALICIWIASIALSGCGAAPTEPVIEPSSPASTTVVEAAALSGDSPVVLTLVGMEKTLTFTLEEIKALPATTGQAGMKSSTGKITVPWPYKGVLLTDLVDMVGGLSADFGVNVVANDGYAMTLSADQISNGGFIAYDPSDGSEKEYDKPLQVLVAYEANGQPLDERSEGVLRLVIISEENNQVTDGHWSVKWVERIEIMPLVMEWSLALNGVRQEVIDRNTFQSCGAASCHQSTWTDEEGQVWSGVPLYLLAGRMDDETSHDGPAYNRDLANAGYVIQLVAGDGYTVDIDSADAYYNRNILVANMVEDAALPDQYFPLRLVGEGLEKGQRIGGITEIRLVMDGLQEPTVEATGAVGLKRNSMGWRAPRRSRYLDYRPGCQFDDPDRRGAAYPPACNSHVGTSQKRNTGYTGVYLSAILALASPLSGSGEIVMISSDGYQTTLDLAAVRACTQCMLAFTEVEGAYLLVMPGFESSAWAKDLVVIELK